MQNVLIQGRLFIAGVVAVLGVVISNPAAHAQDTGSGWKAGVARTDITPGEPLWMAGYASRSHPAEGSEHPLWAKAIAFEDAAGNQAVLVTTDVLGLPKGMSDTIRDQIEAEYGLSRAEVALNSSHTHSGPVLKDALYDIYPLDEGEEAKIARYSSELEDQIVQLVGEALGDLEPAEVYSGNGVTRFAVNRRNNHESEVVHAIDLDGPTDYSVPVLKVESPDGDLRAVVFGYACHSTTLDFYKWCGDYGGFAQIKLEEDHPGATALFFAGSGGDQNPIPRRSVALARQYGRELAAAVDRVLEEPMEALTPELTTVYKEAELQLSTPPSRETLETMAEHGASYQQRWAKRMVAKLDRGEERRTSYPYPVQLWKLGGQLIVTLGGEVVIDYTVNIKRMLGQDTFVMAYTNDVMGYIPSVRILREGGYEGASSQIVYGLPSTWEADIELRVMNAVRDLVQEAGLELPESSL